MTTAPTTGWGARGGDATVVVLLRHGVTAHTVRKVFSGSGGDDPALTDVGHAQARRAAEWIERAGGADAVVASPLLRTQETAGAVAERFGLDVALEPGVAEASFGDWDGSTFSEIAERWPDEMRSWLGSSSVAPPNGESFDDVDARVLAARERIVADHPGQVVVVVSHVTPIKLLVRDAIGAPLDVIHRMELAPAAISTIAYWPEGQPSLRSFSVVP